MKPAETSQFGKSALASTGALPAALDLTPEEEKRLNRCEVVLTTNLDSFIEVGLALAEIRRDRLYRKTADTFENYLATRWKIVRSHGYRLIRSAHVVQALRDIAGEGSFPMPGNERIVRELESLESPHDMARVLHKAQDLAGNKPITNRFIRQAKMELGFTPHFAEMHESRTRNPSTIINAGKLMQHAITELRLIHASLQLRPDCRVEAARVMRLFKRLGGEDHPHGTA